MIKTSLAFLTGVLSMGVIVYMAGARFAVPMFFAGICFVVVPVIAVLSSVQRIRSVARFMLAFADSWDGANSPRKQTGPRVVSGKNSNPWGWVKPSPKQRDRDLESNIEWMKEEAAS